MKQRPNPSQNQKHPQQSQSISSNKKTNNQTKKLELQQQQIQTDKTLGVTARGHQQWELKSPINLNLEIQPYSQNLQHQPNLGLNFNQTSTTMFMNATSQQPPQSSSSKANLPFSSSSKQSPFKQNSLKRVHMVPICFQRAEELMRQSLQSDRTYSPSQRGNLSNSKILHQSINKSMKLQNTNNNSIKNHPHHNHSLSQEANNVPAFMDELEKLTADSNNFFHLSPTNQNGAGQNQLLDPKFYKKGNYSPRFHQTQSYLTTVKSVDKIANSSNNKQNKEKSATGMFSHPRDSQSSNNLTKRQQRQERRNQNRERLLISEQQQFSNRTKIQPALIQLNSSDTNDKFNRSKLLYFKPTPSQQLKYENQHMKETPKNISYNQKNQQQSYNIQQSPLPNHKNTSSEHQNLDLSHLNLARENADLQTKPNQSDEEDGNPLDEIINYQQHEQIDDFTQLVSNHQLTEAEVEDQNQNQNLQDNEDRVIYKKQARTKKVQWNIQNRIINKDLDKSQDLKLVKYLSPLKQHFRIAHKDNTQHKHDQQHLNNDLFSPEKNKQLKNVQQISPSQSNLLTPVDPLLVLSKHDLKDDCKSFVKMLKQFKDKKQELFENQVQSQSRDIDQFFRNHNHQTPTHLSLRNNVVFSSQSKNLLLKVKDHQDLENQLNNMRSQGHIAQNQPQSNDRVKRHVEFLSPRTENKANLGSQNKNNQNHRLNSTKNQYQNVSRQFIDIKLNQTQQNPQRYELNLQIQNPENTGLQDDKIIDSPKLKKQRVISQLNSQNRQNKYHSQKLRQSQQSFYQNKRIQIKSNNGFEDDESNQNQKQHYKILSDRMNASNNLNQNGSLTNKILQNQLIIQQHLKQAQPKNQTQNYKQAPFKNHHQSEKYQFSPFFNQQIIGSQNNLSNYDFSQYSAFEGHFEKKSPKQLEDFKDLIRVYPNNKQKITQKSNNVQSPISSLNTKQIQKHLDLSIMSNQQNQLLSVYQKKESLLRRKRRDRQNFEREKLLALAVPGYADYVFNF